MQTTDPKQHVRLTATVRGYVQGVGFRFSTLAYASSLNLVGVAENLMNGDVLVIAEGPREDCQKVLDWLAGRGSRSVRRPGRVESIQSEWGPARGGFRSFTYR